VRRRLLALLALVFGAHLVVVGSVRWIDPPLTLTMLGAAWEHRALPQRDWRPLDELGHLPRMAVAGEDGAFWLHDGFDWVGICTAIDTNRRNRARGSSARAGGSTIPQQVARNVFLWQGRSWLRKGLETWLTLWLVRLVPRERILELYLNLAQTGPATFGAEAGAQRAFGKSAAKLTPTQAARLIAILPAPARWSVTDADVKGKARTILQNRDPWPGEEHFEAVADAYAEKNPGPLGCAWRQLVR
jgi:monofunctional biosynthetic peptidoglycan transglycosylase